MAIKAIINNTEKEIEQIKNSDEQDIDYVYSRIGDTEVEGELPISIKSIGGNLADYRIYGQTVDGESVGDRTRNLFDYNAMRDGVSSKYIDSTGVEVVNAGWSITKFIPCLGTEFTLNTSLQTGLAPSICLYDEDYNIINAVPYSGGTNIHISTIDDKIAKFIRFSYGKNWLLNNVMLNSGSQALPYEPYGYKVPVTVEGKNLFDESATSTINGYKDGAYINQSGREISESIYAISEYIFIPEGANMISMNVPVILFSPSICFYGNDKTYISGANYNHRSVVTESIPIGAKYLRFTVVKQYADTTMLNVGTTALPYEPYHAPVTTPIYLPEPIKMVGDEAEYIDYSEQKFHRISGANLDVTLPALSTIKGTNTLSVNTSIQPSNIYIKDNFDYKRIFTATRTIEDELPLSYRSIEDSDSTLSNYRIYGNTETLTRSYSGTAPLSFPITDGAVSNYRVYGNTVNGESVGDKTANILPLSRTPITETHGDFLCEYDGLGAITLTTNKDNAVTDGEFVIPLIQNFTIPVSIGQGGTGCFQINNSISGNPTNNIKLYYNNTQIDTWNLNEINRLNSNYTGMGNKTINSISVRINNGGTNRKITIKPAFVENVTEQVPFEPYGYKTPVTNNSETENIYLDEPLRKVGDEAEYADYAEQKWHRVRKNLLENTAKSQTINGVTFTVNSDGSVTCNGTASVSTFFPLKQHLQLEEGQSYYLTGCPTGGGGSSFRLYAQTDLGVNFYLDSGNGAIINYISQLEVLIVIYSGYTCDNLTFYPMIRLASIEDDTYEPYIENVDLDVTIPALPAQSTSNSLSIGTSVQPSSVAVDVAEVVSCGDRTENLFDKDEYLIGGTQNPTINTNYRHVIINLKPNTLYTFSSNVPRAAGYNHLYIYDDDWIQLQGSFYKDKPITVLSNSSGTINFEYAKRSYYNDLLSGKYYIMLNAGSTAQSYEPYGKYKIPVTLTADSAETTDIYLNAPLAKSGNNADYIDYATQKRHNSDGAESNVILPEIAVTAGTNTMTVGTEVQPSSVEIKGHIK